MLPSRALTRLPKKFISVNGSDASKFLNGLLTVRPPDNEHSPAPAGSFAALLNSKGRVVSDLFVYCVNSVDWLNTKYLIEVDEAVHDKVLGQLDFYRLAADVELDTTTLKSHYFWDDEAGSCPEFEGTLTFSDFRVPSLGSKLIGEQDLKTSTTTESYDIRRYLFGIPEGSKEWISGKTLPLEYDLDYLHGVDFNKGCYVGQELTIRTYHHGVIRKRVVPVIFTAPGAEIPEDGYAPLQFAISSGDAIRDESPVPNSQQIVNNPFGSVGREIPAGSIVAAIGNVGLASLRTDKLGHAFSLANGTQVHAMQPFWWPEVGEAAVN